jgi:acetyltransferase-like isoleucine patch superfamily enzyme
MDRPSWDTYFINIAKLTSERSNCIKRRVGCILVKNKRILSLGYNGTPVGTLNCYQGGCKRCYDQWCNNNVDSAAKSLDLCMCLHAEENAILFNKREDLEKIGFKSIGENVLISDKCSIYNAKRIDIGNNVRIDDFCVISAGEAGIEIGNNVHIAVYCSIIGKSKITLSDFSGLSSFNTILLIEFANWSSVDIFCLAILA